MTLDTELRNWKTKKTEAEAKLKEAEGNRTLESKYGTEARVASENINRIKNVLSVRPQTDDLEAEDKRHFNAVEGINKKWIGRTHPAVA